MRKAFFTFLLDSLLFLLMFLLNSPIVTKIILIKMAEYCFIVILVKKWRVKGKALTIDRWTYKIVVIFWKKKVVLRKFENTISLFSLSRPVKADVDDSIILSWWVNISQNVCSSLALSVTWIIRSKGRASNEIRSKKIKFN